MNVQTKICTHIENTQELIIENTQERTYWKYTRNAHWKYTRTAHWKYLRTLTLKILKNCPLKVCKKIYIENTQELINEIVQEKNCIRRWTRAQAISLVVALLQRYTQERGKWPERHSHPKREAKLQIQTTKRKAHNWRALRDTGRNTTWLEKWSQNAKRRAANDQHKMVRKHTDHRTAHCTHREDPTNEQHVMQGSLRNKQLQLQNAK